MKSIEIGVRLICWMLWVMTYTLLAAWVGEGLWHYNGTRLVATAGLLIWTLAGGAIIEWNGIPKALANAMQDDEQ